MLLMLLLYLLLRTFFGLINLGVVLEPAFDVGLLAAVLAFSRKVVSVRHPAPSGVGFGVPFDAIFIYEGSHPLK
ncbi:unnamed protein product [Calypogeia fissa]